MFPGRDYGNVNYQVFYLDLIFIFLFFFIFIVSLILKTKGESNGKAWDEQIDRTKQPRMPWHDVHMCVDGTAAWDMALNFIVFV